MKEWSEIVSKWNAMNVPDVGFIPYQFDKHDEYQPWYEIKTKQQVKFKVLPIYDTAKHLMLLRHQDEELMIAFKLLGFIKANIATPLEDDLTENVLKVMNDYGYYYSSWWHPKARYIYPETFGKQRRLLRNYKSSSIDDVEQFVEQAALMWKSVAEYYALIEIPYFQELQKLYRLK